MTMQCTICTHPKRLEIDRDIVAGMAHTKIGKKYGVSNQAVRSHAANHLSRQLVTAYEHRKASDNLDLMNRIDRMINNAEVIFQRNFKAKKDYVALQALNSQKGIIELLAKISAYLHESRAMELEANRHEQSKQIQDGISNLPACELNMLANLQAKIQGRIPSYKRLLPDSFYDTESEEYINITVDAPSGIANGSTIIRTEKQGGSVTVDAEEVMDNFVDDDNEDEDEADITEETPDPKPEPEPRMKRMFHRPNSSFRHI